MKKSLGGTDTVVEIGGGTTQDGVWNEYKYTSTNNQTTYTGTDDDGKTLSYLVGYLQVFFNGILLDNGIDYAATNSSSIILTNAASTSDIVQISSFAKVLGTGDVTRSTLSGNGSTTAFTIASAPTHENNLQVFIDGVYQEKSTYSLSSTTLTFSTAPANGTTIEVMIGTNNVTVDGVQDLAIGGNLTVAGTSIFSASMTGNLTGNASGSAGTATSLFDNHSVTVSSDAMGTLKFHGEGGDSAQNAVGDTAAGNIWDNFDGKNGATATLSESNSGTNFNYTLPSLVDGLAVGVSYLPAGANDESDTAYSLVYTGVEGLTLSYGSGTSDGDAAGSGGTAANADTTSMKASYAIGSFTLAYSDHDHDSNTDTSDQTATSWKVSYTVSDALSVTYATDKLDDNATAATSDAEYTKITAAHTSGGMTVSANYKEASNGDYTTSALSDVEYIGLSVSFAF